ncbi:MAG: DNA-binding response regulator [Dehalococcoidia bacterium]|nr:DNA-binding response regulator [Dehalococcoidia bacterium]
MTMVTNQAETKTAAAQVLVVDDDPSIRHLVAAACDGIYRVSEAASAEAALAQVKAALPDLVILDLAMPGIGGLAFIPEFRSLSDAPIIVLSVVDAEATKVTALEAGADDYLTKPFGTNELVARIARHLTRWDQQRHQSAGAASGVFKTADDHLVVDTQARTVQAAGRDVHLTALEFEALAYLARFPDRVVTSRQFLRAVWGIDSGALPTVVRITIYRLRQKLEPEPGQPRYLLTEPTVGYRLRSTPSL